MLTLEIAAEDKKYSLGVVCTLAIWYMIACSLVRFWGACPMSSAKNVGGCGLQKSTRW